VTRRFLLHNSRENEDIKESDFDELKMEFQTVKADMLNDMRGAKENLIRYTNVIYKGINVLNELFASRHIYTLLKSETPTPTTPTPYFLKSLDGGNKKTSKTGESKEEIEKKLLLFRSCSTMFQKDIDDLYNPIYNRFTNPGSLVLRPSSTMLSSEK
jgi:hypothetical protein